MSDLVALVAAMLAGLVVFGVVVRLGTPWARADGRLRGSPDAM